MLLHSAIYSTLNGFFVFAGRKKRKKRGGGEVGRRDDGGELEPGRGMTAGRVGMTASGRLVVCRWSWWWCYGVTTIKDCYYTAFGAMRGGGEDYFCTVPTLHRRRWWIGSRGRVQLVRMEGGGRDANGSQAEGVAAAAGRAIPPYRLRGLGRYVGLVSRNFFLSLGSPRSAVLADSNCVSCCICVDMERVGRKLYSF